MRDTIVGAVVGLVVGVVVGATLIAPSLPVPQKNKNQKAETVLPSPKIQIDTAWKITGPYPSTLPTLGSLAKRLEDQVVKVTGGALDLRYYEPGTLTKPAEIVDALKNNAIQGAFISPNLLGGEAPALQIRAGIPFGPAPKEFLAWLHQKGEKLFQPVYEKLGLRAIPCGLTVANAGGWFKEPVVATEDLKGVRGVFEGLGGKVLASLGVEILPLMGGEVFAALEAGKLDAVAFSIPVIDQRLGFQKFAPHYYLPGWQNQAGLLDFVVREDNWKELPASQKAAVETVCSDNVRQALASGEAEQPGALKALQKEGARLRRWPDEVLRDLKKAWVAVAKNEAENDAAFAKIHASLKDFHRGYGQWQDLGYLRR